jgi:Beta propeller domain
MRLGHGAMAAMLALAAAGAAEAQRSQRHVVTPERRSEARAALDAFTSPGLTRFRDEAEFRRYVAAVREEERTRDDHYYTYSAATPAPLRFAQSVAPPEPGATATRSDTTPPCIPTAANPCDEPDGGASITVTGSRIRAPRNPSITNNQMRGVEEGDIIKQIDDYLLILQDGRIFVVDITTGGSARRPGRELRLTDRVDVYRNSNAETWYDEMLVSGDRVLVTGYSYEAAASELAVFRLDTRTGRLRREGLFRIASDDYYDTMGYATRLIGDDLVVYTPFRLSDIDDEDYVWPRVRPWLPQDDARERDWLDRRERNWIEREALAPAGPLLLEGSDIYRPVERLEDPVVHTVSVCPLASAGAGSLACRSTAIVGPGVRQWYVTADHAYLWTGSEVDYCEADSRGEAVTIANARRALVYRMPIAGTPPDLIAARGAPPDQFALQADGRNLYALVKLEHADCEEGFYDPARLAFVTLPLARFAPTLTQAPSGAFVALPGTPTAQIAARFTDHYLVYGALSSFRRGLPDPNDFARYGLNEYVEQQFAAMRPAPAVVVPILQPELARSLDTGHTVIRADRLGDDIILTGYRDREGLSVTLVDLDGRPRIGSTLRLPGRYESEGRSHAFNSRANPDGSSLMGLPTVARARDSDRHSWRSSASDLSFLTADIRGRLRPAGVLLRRFDYVDDYDRETEAEDEDGVPGYQCEVSCTDWYGNSRPIFTDGRIFGLSGTELIEGRFAAGRVGEVRRLNIALSPVPGR